MATVNKLLRLHRWLRLTIEQQSSSRRLTYAFQTHLTCSALAFGHAQLVACSYATSLHASFCIVSTTVRDARMSRIQQDMLTVRDHHAVGHGLGLQGPTRWMCMMCGVCLQMHAPVSRDCLEHELADNTFAQSKQ